MAEGDSKALITRSMPYDNKAEQAVIGGIMIDNSAIEAILDELPNGKAFYNPSYGHIYDAMVSLHQKAMAIDLVTLQNRLREMDVPPETANPELLMEAIGGGVTSVHVRDYARVVSEKALLRELIKTTEDIVADCYEQKADVDELFADAEKKIYNVVQRKAVRDLRPVGDIVWDALETIREAAQTEGDITGLATGFTDLDHKTHGFQPGNLVLVAARPAMGKTSFVLSMMRNIVIRQRKPVLMFSLEMTTKELMNRMLAMTALVDSQKFKSGQLSDAEWEKLAESGGEIAHSGMYLDDTATSLREIRSIARRYRIEKKIELVIIDYLQLMNSTGGRKSDSRQQEISDISRGLKLLAKELEIPIIALSQLSRGVESRTDHHPMLSDLRESGAIEQDADTVIFIYREEVYNPDTKDKKNIAEIMVSKQRSGSIGTVEMLWVPERTQFENLARQKL